MRTRARNALWTFWMPLANRAARGYVAGPQLADGLRVCGELQQHGITATLCFWNPQGLSHRAVADGYLAALTAMRKHAPDAYLSVKAPEIGFSRTLALAVADRARQVGARMHFDSHGPETTDPTFALITRVHGTYPDLGCTLPGRWRRSLRDADRAVDMGLSVRVVKGQWSDPERPEVDHRQGYLEVVDRLAGRAKHVAVASHDPVVARAALERLRAAGTPCELELLYGLPAAPALQVARELGVPVRFYVPYGHGWLPYCFTQMTRNPRMVGWLLRDLVWHRQPATVVAPRPNPGNR